MAATSDDVYAAVRGWLEAHLDSWRIKSASRLITRRSVGEGTLIGGLVSAANTRSSPPRACWAARAGSGR